MEYLNQLGPLVLASRLKNLSDKLMQGVSRIYREMHVEFEPRWFPVTYYLYHIGPAQVTHLANALRQTHPAVLQVTSAMNKKGLIKVRKDEHDQRKTIVSLSSKGLELAKELEEIWEIISAATGKLLEENYIEILENIALLEDAFDQEDIYSRIKTQYVLKHLMDLQIREFTPSDMKEFEAVNLEWLKDTVGVSHYDLEFLKNPRREVLDKGGMIYMAFAGNELTGTVTLLPLDKEKMELTKLAVKKKYRGLGIGKRLAYFAVEQAKQKQYSSILLLTHPVLKEAIGLYHKMGFETIPGHPALPDKTGRCSLTMELILNKP